MKKDTVPEPDRGVATLDEDTNNQGQTHEPDILPHNYNDEDLKSMFPGAVAPEDPDEVPTDQCISGRPTRVDCFPPHPQASSHDGLWRENWLTRKYDI